MKPTFTHSFAGKLFSAIKKSLTVVLTALAFLLTANKSQAACKAYFLNTVSGDTAHFYSYSKPGLDDSIVSYSWTFGDGKTSTLENPIHKYGKVGIDTVCLTITTKKGCTSTYCNAVVISAAVCNADFSFVVTGDTVKFTNLSTTGKLDSITSYYWMFGDGTVGGKQDPTHKYYQTGTDTVCLTIFTKLGCSASICKLVTITTGACQAFFGANISGDSVHFINFSRPGKGDSIVSFEWSFGDGTFGTKRSPHHYYKPGIDTVCLTIHTRLGCTSYYCQVVNITNSNCEALFKATITGDTVHFHNNSVAGVGDSIIGYVWHFGDGSPTSNEMNPIHIYKKSGNDTVCLSIITQSGCANTYCHVVTIASTTCTAFFNVTINNDSVQFNDKSKPAIGDSIILYFWTFGDGKTGNKSDPLHIYSATGTYNVCLTIITSSGCSNTYCRDVVITNTSCRSKFKATVLGDSVEFTNESTASVGDVITSYFWSFGDGQTSVDQNPTHVYNRSGTDTVCLTIFTKQGCSSTDCHVVTVINDKCTASFNSTVTGDTVQFTNNSTAAIGDSIIIYYWTFGDGSTSTSANPSHVYSKTGSDTVCLTIFTKLGCTSTDCNTISVVNNSCQAFFGTTIYGDSVQFNNFSTAGTGDNITGYLWTFGDSTLSLQKEPHHTYTKSGTFTACLTITTALGCTSNYCRSVIIVNTACNAYFNTTAAGDTITFNDYSTAGTGDSITSYIWAFGDGTFSSLKDPVHNYGKTGNDTVCLTINTKLGCTSMYCSKVSFVNTNCNAYFTTTTQGDSIMFNNLSTTGASDSLVTYSWVFGDGTTGTGANPTHVYQKTAIDTICLTITTKLGCSSSYCTTINFINTACQAFFNTSISGDTVNIIDNSTTGTDDSIINYSWIFGDGNTGTGAAPQHIYNKTGNDTICLTITTKFGCSSNFCRDISVVNTACHANFVPSISGGDSVHFNNYSTVGSGDTIISYSWSFGDGNTSTASNPLHVYTKTGADTVCLTITTAFGCSSDYCSIIDVVNTACLAYFKAAVSGGDSAQFTNLSTTGAGDSITTYSWIFGDGTTGSTANPTHVYVQTGIDTVCLTIATKFGCTNSYCSTVSVTNTLCSASFNTTINGDSVSFNDFSTTGTGDSILSYSWSFGDGGKSTMKNPVHVYTKSGVDTVCLTITTKYGCTSTSCQPVTINIYTCQAYFTTISSGNIVYFNNYSTTSAGDSIVSYYYTFGDGGSSASPDTVHLYTASGIDTACLTITTKEGCTSTYCQALNITAATCQAYFYFTVSGDTVQFNNLSYSNDSIISYAWSFGDTASGVGQSPQHVYSKPGSYFACLTIYSLSGCLSIYCDSVQIGNASGINNVVPGVNYSVGKVYPNPTTNNSSMLVQADHDIQIVLSVKNILGQEIYTNTRHIQTGASILTIPSAAFANGMYFIELNVNNSAMVVRKLIKE